MPRIDQEIRCRRNDCAGNPKNEGSRFSDPSIAYGLICRRRGESAPAVRERRLREILNEVFGKADCREGIGLKHRSGLQVRQDLQRRQRDAVGGVSNPGSRTVPAPAMKPSPFPVERRRRVAGFHQPPGRDQRTPTTECRARGGRSGSRLRLPRHRYRQARAAPVRRGPAEAP